ncbi:hypothetical protein AVEN_225097-1 [Araneus ventricosus]|uniref:Uncharacterized protein n=1 Tax=Araneus ventricosus TaxID=182803 RepID=A0A4Y2IAK5_ARAVE|nr:hypothetical protein AVEN_225097-1 [Araneus ventricosus]
MEENIPENKNATPKIPHSSEMKPLVLTEQFYAQIDEKHQDYETSEEASTNKSNLVKNTTEKTHICNRIFNDGGYNKRNAVWVLQNIYSVKKSHSNFHREYLKTALKWETICTAFRLLDMNPMIYENSGFTDCTFSE